MKLRQWVSVVMLMCGAAVAVPIARQAGSGQSALEAARKTAVVDGNLLAAIKLYRRSSIGTRRRTGPRLPRRSCAWRARIRSWAMRRPRESTSRSSRTTRTSRQPSARRARTCAQPTIRAHRSLRYAWCARLMRRPPNQPISGRTDLGYVWVVPPGLGNWEDQSLESALQCDAGRTEADGPLRGCQWPVLTRDSKQVAYEWYVWDGAKWNSQLRVMSTEAGAKPRTLVDNPEFTYFIPIGWANDARSLLTVIIGRKMRPTTWHGCRLLTEP